MQDGVESSGGAEEPPAHAATEDEAAPQPVGPDEASPLEKERARRLADYLHASMALPFDAPVQAQLRHDLARLHGGPLSDAAEALELLREASRLALEAPHIARAYRAAAMRVESWADVVAALEREVKCDPEGQAAADLESERGWILEHHLGFPRAARVAYENAAEVSPKCLRALAGAERLSLLSGDPAAAARWAAGLSDRVTDPALFAAHRARAARHRESAGDQPGAIEWAAQAQARCPQSAAAEFALERLCAAAQSEAGLLDLRRAQIELGRIDPVEGWFDVGVIARYRLGDREVAADAFDRAAQVASDEDRAASLRELASLFARGDQGQRALQVETARLKVARSAEERASIWHRIGMLRAEHAGDEEGAHDAFESCLAEDPHHAPALQDARRLCHRRGATGRLVKLHRAQAEAAVDDVERARALCRVGELLVGDPATLDEGIELLVANRPALPGDLRVFSVLEKALTDKGAWDRLADLYEQAVERAVTPNHRASLYLRLGMTCADRLDDPERALAALRRAAEGTAHPPPEALVRLAELLQVADDQDELSQVLRRLTSHAVEPVARASLLQRLARVHERRGAPEEAAEVYREALKTAPESHSVYGAAGRAFMRSGDDESLVALLLAATAGVPPEASAPWLHEAARVLWRRLGRIDEAVDKLRACLAAAPGYVPARRTLVDLLDEQERWAELSAELEGGSDRAADLLRRAVLAEATGEPARALSLYREALAGGLGVARLPCLRLMPVVGEWAELERTYAGLEQPWASYRAGEIAAERLGEPSRAAEHFEAARQACPDDPSAFVALVRLWAGEPEKLCTLLESVVPAVQDPVSRPALEATLADTLELLGRPEAALAHRLRLLEGSARDPVRSMRVQAALRATGRRSELVKVLRQGVAAQRTDGSAGASVLADLGGVLEELGAVREAADTLEASVAEEGPYLSLSTRLVLVRLYRALDDQEATIDAIRRLSDVLLKDDERATCLRVVGHLLYESRRDDEALDAYFEALRAHPLDYESLCEADALLAARGEAERLIDPLTRAFEAEQRHAPLVDVGGVLAVRLTRAGRFERAREVVERLLAVEPAERRALMVLAEIQEKTDEWAAAVESLVAVADHPDTPPAVQREAFLRMALIQVERLDDRAAARQSASRLSVLPAEDTEDLERLLHLQESLEEFVGAAETLRALLLRAGHDEGARSGYALRLAAIEEARLGDGPAAIETLREVRSTAHRREAVERLLRLGEAAGRWEQACAVLEELLADEGWMDPAWETGVRAKVAAIYEKELHRPDAAMGHYERITKLDPGDIRAIERLVDLVGESDVDKAIEYRRAFVIACPDRKETYRILRGLFVEAKDEDAAFLSEAVMVGLGDATEEEAYFYKQRRSFLARGFATTLTGEDVRLLFPEMDQPAVALARAIEPLLPRILPVDHAAHGVEPGRPSTSEPLGRVAAAMAQLFGVGAYELHLVGARVGPVAEPGAPPLLIVPRELEDGLQREQQFVLGALLGRVALGAMLADPLRGNAVTPTSLEYLIEAATALGLPDLEPRTDGRPVYADLVKRLREALQGARRERVVEAARTLADSGQAVDGGAILRAMNTAVARAAILASQDPAVAGDAFSTYARMFGGDPGSLPDACRDALPFAVSEGHEELRRRLMCGVTS